MAISRAQLLKELLPGLNALFGMEYARYGEEAMTGDWSEGFYVGLRAAGYVLEGAGRFVPESA